MVPAERSCRRGRGAGRRHDRPLRPHHAVARRDGARREGDGAARASTLPLLIGGATTSRQHTAVKIAPEYSGSRSCTCSTRRARSASSRACSTSTQRDGVRPREPRRSRRRCASSTRSAARSRSCRSTRRPANRAGHRLGRRGPAGAVVPRDAARARCRSRSCVPFIDWTFFFTAWELKGRVPGDPRAPAVRARRRASSSTTRRRCSTGSSTRRLLTARGVYGFWPAASDGDDIVLLRRRDADDELAARSRCCGSRRHRGRQAEPLARRLRRAGRVAAGATTSARSPSRPASARTSSSRAFERDHDDYNAIMAKALADRLAEAFAECLHARARRDWGYGAGRDALATRTSIAEKYRGIRPAFGYPACPDHTEKGTLFDAARRRGGRHRADRELRDDAGGERQRPLLRPPEGPLLRGRPPRRRPGRGLRARARA